jgi:hypothetical protein
MDSRITPATRKIILTIKDNTPIPFSNKDQEWMAEVIEDKLKERFDLEIELIEVEGN